MSVFFMFTLVLRLRLIKEKANEANLLTASVCMCCFFGFCVCGVYIICLVFNNFLICPFVCVSFATIRFTREVSNWNYMVPSNRSLDGFFSVYFFLNLNVCLLAHKGCYEKLHYIQQVLVCVFACVCVYEPIMHGWDFVCRFCFVCYQLDVFTAFFLFVFV